MNANMQVTFFLPLFIDVRRRVSDLDRFLALGLQSMEHFLDRASVRELIVATPDRDVARVRRAISNRSSLPCRVLADSEVWSTSAKVSGWYKQQILKLAVAGSHVRTDWYITLDADVICVRPLDASFLFDDSGKGIWQKEPAGDHFKWWQGSRRVLGATVDVKEDDVVFGVTPALMHRAAVVDLMRAIERRHGGRDWTEVLSSMTDEAWSEYTLYWLHLLEARRTTDLYSTVARKLYGRSVWIQDDLTEATADWCRKIFDPAARHAFVVFQSHLELPLAQLVRLLRPHFGASPALSSDERLRSVVHQARHIVAREAKRVRSGTSNVPLLRSTYRALRRLSSRS